MKTCRLSGRLIALTALLVSTQLNTSCISDGKCVYSFIPYLSREKVYFEAEEDSVRIYMRTCDSWRIVFDDPDNDWCYPTMTQAPKGECDFWIKTAANPSTSERSTSLTIRCNDVKQTISIFQEGKRQSTH